MKTYTVGVRITLLMLGGCGGSESVELQSAEVEISDSRVGVAPVISGDLEGENFPVVSLGYDITLKNTGGNTLGTAEITNEATRDSEGTITPVLEPHEELMDAVDEVIGEDIFTEEGRQNAVLDIQHSGAAALDPNEEANYSVDFFLGAKQDNLNIEATPSEEELMPNMSMAPSEEELAAIYEQAMEATLVIYAEKEEVARFDLSE